MADISVVVSRSGRRIDEVERPLHNTAKGPAVRYRRTLWPVVDGCIDLDKPSFDDGPEPMPGEPAAIEVEEGPDLSQAAVVKLPQNARVLVDAGPGTGKTHVACERIASLINRGVDANHIWVISFTRAAIAEFRNRIGAMLADEADAASVRIATLDSYAWTIQSGFARDPITTGSYDENIDHALKRIHDDEDARDYLKKLEHLVIDEAQDIIGPRARLVSTLVNALDPNCGVTVFADPAQAIYDFSNQHEADEVLRLLDLLSNSGFTCQALDRLHRTKDPRLKGIFSGVRTRVMSQSGKAASRYEKVKNEIIRLAHADAGAVSDFSLVGLSPDTLVLLRRRSEVLDRSSRNGETPHRLRMSGFPCRILPWLAEVFWDHIQPFVSEADFRSRWDERIAGAVCAGAPAREEAWRLLVEAAGKSSRLVEMDRLRTILGRSNPSMLFCSAEFGDSGPILSTVHASKGREADDVKLFLPVACSDRAGFDEEARICFVGATRARKRLEVGSAHGGNADQIRSGRVWRRTKSGRVQVEIGREHDLTAAGLTGKAAFATADDARLAQEAWRTQSIRQNLRAHQEASLDWQYALLADDQRLAVLSSKFKREMQEVARKADKPHAAGTLPYIRSLGLRSLVISRDDSELETLHHPWCQSGFMFAPLLSGYSSGKF